MTASGPADATDEAELTFKRLCPHVQIAVDKAPVPPRVVARGAVYPYFSWSVELQADVPRLKCSTCGKAVKIMGHAVSRARPFLGRPGADTDEQENDT